MSFDPETVDWESVGVPTHVADELRQREWPKSWRWYFWLQIAVVLAATLFACWSGFLWLWLDDAIHSSPGESTLFTDHDLGVPVALWMLGSTLAVCIPLSYVDRLFPASVRVFLLGYGIHFSRRTHGIGALVQQGLNRRAAESVQSNDPLDCLDAQNAVVRRWLGIPGLVLLAAALVAMPFDLASYVRGTTEGIERHSLLQVERIPYEEVVAVKTGCGGSRNFPHYDLVLADGEVVQALPRCLDAAHLARLQQLDDTLRNRRVRVRPWSSARSGVVGTAPECVRAVAACAGVDAHELGVLLDARAR